MSRIKYHNIYIKELSDRVSLILKTNLNSLYIVGSKASEDYVEGTSDLDIFGITQAAITNTEKDSLEQILKHSNFLCPANGLDLVLVSRKNIEVIRQKPAYEFWYSTGFNWPEESWESGKSSEILIWMKLCELYGVQIYGEYSSKEFGVIGNRLLLNAFLDIIKWHKQYILDDYHDPEGQNSILNACRIIKYIETKQLYSKTEGAKECLKDEPNNKTIAKALRNRTKVSSEKISREEIQIILSKVEQELKFALK